LSNKRKKKKKKMMKRRMTRMRKLWNWIVMRKMTLIGKIYLVTSKKRIRMILKITRHHITKTKTILV